jgi:hypothetical protein
MHILYKFIKNGGGRSTPKIIERELESLSDVWEYYDTKRLRYTETNVYYQINPSSRNITAKAKKTDILNCVAIPIDVDGFKDRDDIAKLEEDIRAFFNRAKINSYISINSGNGLHVVVHTGKQQSTFIERYKDSIKMILYKPIESMIEKYDGAHIDIKVLESARILRVPFTINAKDGKPEQECSIITNSWDEEDENTALLEHFKEGVEEPKVNIVFDEIVKAFEDIGAEWRNSQDYSFIKHPARENFDNLCIYKNSRHFWNFSDNDTQKWYSLEDVWNMHGSGKPYPFMVGKTDDTDLIIEFLKKTYDLRYSEQAKGKIVYDQDGHPSYMTETNYKNAIKDGFSEYLSKINASSDGAKTALLRFKKVMDKLPQKFYHADPIEEELNSTLAQLSTMWTNRFEYFDDEAKKNVRSSIAELVKLENFDVLKEKGITYDDTKFCISYNAISNLFGDSKKYAASKQEFIAMLKWCGLNISANGGAVCVFNTKKIEFEDARKIK